MAKQAVYIVVRGRVQGVGFRFFVRSHAARLGIDGWVRNRADGSVDLHAEGNRASLDALIERLHEGPTFGYVEDLHVDWSEESEHLASFDIRY